MADFSEDQRGRVASAVRNIVLVVTDQQRADCVPGAVPPAVELPNMAWLAERGLIFERAYCANPLCTPARAALLSGLMPFQTGQVANDGPRPSTGFRTIGNHLSERGWETAYCGKWHLATGSARPGFGTVLGRLTDQDVSSPDDDDAVRQARQWNVALGGNYKGYLRKPGAEGRFHGRSTRLPLNAHPSTQMALQAADWIRRPERKEKPFFLAFSTIEPHAMGGNYRVAPAPFDAMYSPQDFALPGTLREKGVEQLLTGARNYNGLMPADRFSDEEILRKIADYMGAVSYCDFLLGLLLEGLAANDLLSETLIVFTSDHGEMMGHHRMLKKGPVFYEDLVRVPLIVSLPGSGMEPGHRSQVVSHVDLLPTFVECAGGNPPLGLPGRSLVPDFFHNDGADGSAVIEYHSAHWGEPPSPLRALVEKNWKIVCDPEGTVAVYDLRNDPGERTNLAGKTPKEEARLRRALARKLASLQDPWPSVDVPPQVLPQRTGLWNPEKRG